MTNIETINETGTNSYVISNCDAAIIVDPGGRENVERLFFKDTKNHLSKKIKLVVLTHGHYDHTEGAQYIKDKLKVPILMNRKDVGLIGKKKYKLHTRTWVGRMGKMFLSLPRHVEIFTPDIVIGDADYSLDKWGIEGMIIHTPGHTLGSSSILCSNTLISGDTFMNIFQPSETLFAEDYLLYDRTLEKLSKYWFLNIYPGHGSQFRRDVVCDYTGG